MGYLPQIPFLSVLSPQLNLFNLLNTFPFYAIAQMALFDTNCIILCTSLYINCTRSFQITDPFVAKQYVNYYVPITKVCPGSLSIGEKHCGNVIGQVNVLSTESQ